MITAEGRQARRRDRVLSTKLALGWCEDGPQGLVFLIADQKRREEALLSGFDARGYDL